MNKCLSLIVCGWTSYRHKISQFNLRVVRWWILPNLLSRSWQLGCVIVKSLDLRALGDGLGSIGVGGCCFMCVRGFCILFEFPLAYVKRSRLKTSVSQRLTESRATMINRAPQCLPLTKIQHWYIFVDFMPCEVAPWVTKLSSFSIKTFFSVPVERKHCHGDGEALKKFMQHYWKSNPWRLVMRTSATVISS